MDNSNNDDDCHRGVVHRGVVSLGKESTATVSDLDDETICQLPYKFTSSYPARDSTAATSDRLKKDGVARVSDESRKMSGDVGESVGDLPGCRGVVEAV